VRVGGPGRGTASALFEARCVQTASMKTAVANKATETRPARRPRTAAGVTSASSIGAVAVRIASTTKTLLNTILLTGDPPGLRLTCSDSGGR
jgi:hypothetical protein